ncbi:MAG: hypothetical protein IT372_33215 [Polyangiaceae bacterium]|nr:hypothetical protein [Polyangiaceae bacterium]
MTTALGRSTTHHVQTLATGLPQRSTMLPSGLTGSSAGGLGSAVTTALPDGRVMTWAPGLVTSEVLTTPQGLTRAISRSRAAALLDPNDAMSFTTITDTTTVNGLSFLEGFAKAPRTITRTAPLGR